MKIPEKRIEEIKAAVEEAEGPRLSCVGSYNQTCALGHVARTAIPELLAEREEREEEIERLELRLRETAQVLIDEIGADGPTNADEAAINAVTVIQHLNTRAESLEKALAAVRGERDDLNFQLDRVDGWLTHSAAVALAGTKTADKLRDILDGKVTP